MEQYELDKDSVMSLNEEVEQIKRSVDKALREK
jgi:hypothetical protein